MTDIAIGRYYHRDSAVHRLDPRSKLLALLFLIISIFLIRNPWGFLIIASFLMLTIALSHLPLRLILRCLRPVVWLLVSILILHAFFAGGNTTSVGNGRSKPLLSLGPVKVTWEGLCKGVSVSCRFLLVIIGAAVLSLTTMPLQLADGVTDILRPLRKVGLPAHQLPIMIVIALHFIPALFTEAEKLTAAQKARGAQLEGWNTFKKLAALMSILAPLLRSSLRKADELAIGMESRCYHGGARSHLYELTFGKADGIALASAAVMIPFTLAISKLIH